MKSHDHLWTGYAPGRQKRPATARNSFDGEGNPGTQNNDVTRSRARSAFNKERTHDWRPDEDGSGAHKPPTDSARPNKHTESALSARPSRRLSYPFATTVTPPSREDIRRSNLLIPSAKYVPYSAAAFRDIQLRNGNDECITDNNNSAVSKSDMSASELPPIGNRPTSSKSRRSSRDSSSGGIGTRNGAIMKYEKQSLLSVDSSALIDTNSSLSVRAVKRSHVSPGSNGSSSPSHPGVLPAQITVVGGMSRAKSWCATEANAGSNPKLETLFERNGTITQNKEMPYNSTNHARNLELISSERNSVNKPPRARLRMDGATNTNTMQNSKRSNSNSVSNLSKAADISVAETPRFMKNSTPNGFTPRTKSSLQRSHQFRSEQNLVNSSLYNPGNLTARTNRQRQPTTRQHDQHNNSTFKQTVRTPRSNQGLSKPTEVLDSILTPQNIRNIDNCARPDTDSPPGPHNERIVQWLMGVDGAEEPEYPDIEHEDELVEQPTQTDTAIHIVYDDS